jgi:hypothetical protein
MNPYPADGETNVSLTPTCNVTVLLNALPYAQIWLQEYNGTAWNTQYYVNTTTASVNISFIYTNATTNGTTYQWRCVTESMDGWNNATYDFTTHPTYVPPVIPTPDDNGLAASIGAIVGFFAVIGCLTIALKMVERRR